MIRAGGAVSGAWGCGAAGTSGFAMGTLAAGMTTSADASHLAGAYGVSLVEGVVGAGTVGVCCVAGGAALSEAGAGVIAAAGVALGEAGVGAVAAAAALGSSSVAGRTVHFTAGGVFG